MSPKNKKKKEHPRNYPWYSAVNRTDLTQIPHLSSSGLSLPGVLTAALLPSGWLCRKLFLDLLTSDSNFSKET